MTKQALLVKVGAEETEGDALRFSNPSDDSEPRMGYKWLTTTAQCNEIINRLSRGERSAWVINEAKRFDIDIPRKE